MAKKGMKIGMTIFIVFLVAAVVGMGVYIGVTQQTANDNNPAGSGGIQTPTNQGSGTVVCPDTGKTSYYSRAEDKLASTTTYVGSATIELTDGTETNNATTSGTTGDWSGAASVTCGKTFNDYLLTTAGSAAGSRKITGAAASFTASGPSIYRTFETKGFDELQGFMTDNTKPAATSAVYTGTPVANSGVAGSATSFDDLNSTNFTSTTDGNTTTSIGTDGYIDWTLTVKTLSTNKQYIGGVDENGNALRSWLCADIGTNGQHQEPVLSFDGVRLTSAKSSMYADDQTQGNIAASEYCYILPKTIDDVNHQLTIYAKARSGTDPSDDLKFYLYTEGYYSSSKQADKVKIGIYTDAATQTQVATGSNVWFLIDVA